MTDTINKLVTSVEYPESTRNLVQAANETWKQLCVLPQTTKDSLGFENFGGYELKNRENHHDSKELFHFTLKKADALRAQGADWNPAARALLEKLLNESAAVTEACQSIVIDYLQPYGDTLVASALSQLQTWPLRYLHYFPVDGAVAETAHAHCDVGGCTLHLYQDYNGLEYLDDETWLPVPLSNNNTSVIPGMDMQYLTEGAVTATCHRVVPTKETATQGRYSSVLFINFETNKRWDKERYGSLGKQPAGWNYDLDHQAFSDYFISGKDLSSI